MSVDNDDSNIESIDDLFGDDDIIGVSEPKVPSSALNKSAKRMANNVFDNMFVDDSTQQSNSSVSSSINYGMLDSQQDDFINSLFGNDNDGEISSLVSDFSKTDAKPVDDFDLDSLFESDDNADVTDDSTSNKHNNDNNSGIPIDVQHFDNDGNGISSRHIPMPQQSDSIYADEDDAGSTEKDASHDEMPDSNHKTKNDIYSAYDEHDETDAYDTYDSDDIIDMKQKPSLQTAKSVRDGIDRLNIGSIDDDSIADSGDDSMNIDTDSIKDDSSDGGFDDIMAQAYDDTDDIDDDSMSGSDDFDLNDLGDMDIDGLIDGFMEPDSSKKAKKGRKRKGRNSIDADFDNTILDTNDDKYDIDSDDEDYAMHGFDKDSNVTSGATDNHEDAYDTITDETDGTLERSNRNDATRRGNVNDVTNDTSYNGNDDDNSEFNAFETIGTADSMTSSAFKHSTEQVQRMADETIADGVGRPTKNEMDERHRREREERRSRRGLSSTVETEDVDVPQWVVSMRSKIRSNVSHAFLLSGNIRDYMVRNISIQDGIVLTLDPRLSEFDIVCVYDQAHGLNFYESDLVIGDSEPEDYRDAFINAMHEAQDDLGWSRTEDVPTNPVDLFTIISKICEQAPSEGKSGKILMFADFLELLVPDANGSAMRPDERKLSIIMSDMCRSERADECGSVFVFFSDNLTAVSQVIRSTASRTDVIDVPSPVLEERRDFIDHVIDVDDRRLSDGRSLFDDDRDDDANGEGVTKRWFAINTAGLACYQIEDIALRSLSDDKPITKTLVKERKSEIIRTDYENVLEIMDPKSGFDAIGGMDNIKAYFMKNVIQPIHRGDIAAIPMGVLLSGPPGTGKPINYDTLIWRLSYSFEPELTFVGNLKVGDYVFEPNGDLTKVVNFVDKGELEAYELILRDGRSIICSADHIWATKKLGESNYHERTVQEMLDEGLYDNQGGRMNRCRFSIPMNGAVDFPERKFDIDPYVMGAFIGDGSCTQKPLILSNKDQFIVDEVVRLCGFIEAVPQRGCSNWQFVMSDDQIENYKQWYIDVHGKKPQGKVRNMQCDYFFRDFHDIRVLAGEKHIPDIYKYSSIDQRYALIQGLFDTDGTIIKDERYQFRGNVSFTSTSKALIDDIRWILFSLGIDSTITVNDRRGKKHISSNGKEYIRKSIEYRINVNCPNNIKTNLFRLPRKVERCARVKNIEKGRDYTHIQITDIKPLHERKHMCCVTVNRDDGLFLAGEDFVVTHNTMLSKAVAYESGMNCVNLNLNQIMDKWVGSSERNLKRALDCAQAMAPTILFIDEIDEALPNRHNNNDASGVNKRMNQMLLTYFSDTTHRGQVVVLAATNYPDKLDPAIKRMGRFDDHIPMFAPDRFGRARILLIAAKKKGYTLSWFESPDKMINNPFAGIINWLEAGNRPHNQKFVGNQSNYYYNIRIDDGYGQYHNEQHSAYLPEAIQKIIGNPKIAIHEFYRSMEILFEGILTGRTMDAAQGIRESDEEYFARIDRVMSDHADLFFPNPSAPTDREMKSFKFACRRMKLYDMRYGPFYDKTEYMTGAELDVVVSKCITLMRDMVAGDPDRVRRLMQAGEMKDEHDIPFDILREACETILPATVGIKSMEDAALLDATDMSFIPDAKYNTSDSGKDKSYRERLSELRAQMQNANG